MCIVKCGETRGRGSGEEEKNCVGSVAAEQNAEESGKVPLRIAHFASVSTVTPTSVRSAKFHGRKYGRRRGQSAGEERERENDN